MHSFGTLAWASAAASARFPSNAGDRALSYLPLSHIAERLLVELGSLNGTARINATRPDIVWVGLGTPKQDFWIARHRPALEAPG